MSKPATPTPPRHAFGWPAGSVRAILALGVLAVLWLVVLYIFYLSAPKTYELTGRSLARLKAEGTPDDVLKKLAPLKDQELKTQQDFMKALEELPWSKDELNKPLRDRIVKHASKLEVPRSFLYLQVLMVLILAHFFTAHGGSIRPDRDTRSPLGLPRGSVRLLLVAGYVGMGYFLWTHSDRLDLHSIPASEFLLPTGLMLAGFLIGHVLSGLFRRTLGWLPHRFVDLEAWIGLLAIVAMTILILIHLFINPTLGDNLIPVAPLEAFLGAVVGLYFGARS
jgi:hypothetical protein